MTGDPGPDDGAVASPQEALSVLGDETRLTILQALGEADDPLALAGFHLSRLDEEIRSTEPFDATVTFTADGEALSLTVDDDLSVADVTRRPADAENGG